MDDLPGRSAADMHGGHALCCVTFGNAKSDVRARAPEYERTEAANACNYSPVATAVARHNDTRMHKAMMDRS